MEPLQPLTDVAAELGLSRRTIERWIKLDKIATHRQEGDRRIFVDPEQVRRLLRHSPVKGLNMKLTCCIPGQFERLGPDIVAALYREWPSCLAQWTESIYRRQYETCIHWIRPLPPGIPALGAVRDAEDEFTAVVARVPDYQAERHPELHVRAML